MFIRILYSGRNSHLLCWIFFKGLYGKLGWGFVGKNDICFIIRIANNKIRAMRSERREEVFEIDDLKQILLRIFVFIKMTNLKGMDELLWGKELEDMFD